VRIVLTLQLWHRSSVMYRETSVGVIHIMNLGGITMRSNSGGITMRSNFGGITMEFMRMKIPS